MPLDVMGRTRATLMRTASYSYGLEKLDVTELACVVIGIDYWKF